ncbi:MAG: hypothetical protein WDW38_008711 [Sanguina aurantia]
MKLNRLSSLSAYARPESHLTKQTFHGAAVTICGVLLAVVLFCHEVQYFYQMHKVTKMEVDLQRRHDLVISMDLTFPQVPCAILSIDALDISGTAENDASFAKGMSLHKRRLNGQGKQIGKAEYHTPQSQQIVDAGGEHMMSINVQEAMKHLVEMEDEADHHEGCRITGTMTVKRVAGRVHISAHQNMVFQMLPQLLGGHRVPRLLNISHIIHHVSFGPHYPGLVNPLDGFVRTVGTIPQTFKYFLKVVPTEFYSRTGHVTETHQYAVTEYMLPMNDMEGRVPSIDFNYDLSPIVVSINDHPPSLLHFVVRMCAVVGGAFAVTRMTDRFVHTLVTSGQSRRMSMTYDTVREHEIVLSVPLNLGNASTSLRLTHSIASGSQSKPNPFADPAEQQPTRWRVCQEGAVLRDSTAEMAVAVREIHESLCYSNAVLQMWQVLGAKVKYELYRTANEYFCMHAGHEIKVQVAQMMTAGSAEKIPGFVLDVTCRAADGLHMAAAIAMTTFAKRLSPFAQLQRRAVGRLTSDFCLTAPHAIVSAADCRSNAVPTPLRRRSGAAPTPLQRRSNAAQQRKDVARQHGMSLSTLHAQHGVNLPTLHAQNQPLILIHTQSELEQAVGSGEMVLLPQSLHAPKPLLLLTPMTHRLRRTHARMLWDPNPAAILRGHGWLGESALTSRGGKLLMTSYGD